MIDSFIGSDVRFIIARTYFDNGDVSFPTAAPQGPGMISNTTQCEAVGGSCSASADCDLSSNVFVGSCDNTSFGCCISKDELCAEKNESSPGQVPCGSLPVQENDSQDLREDRDDRPDHDDKDTQDENENLDERPDQDDYDNQGERQNLGNDGGRGGHGRGHGGRY